MPRLRRRVGGVVVSVSDDTAAALNKSEWEPVVSPQAPARQKHSKKSE